MGNFIRIYGLFSQQSIYFYFAYQMLYVLPIVTELGWSTHGSFSANPSVSEGESSLKANSSNSSRIASNASQMEVN